MEVMKNDHDVKELTSVTMADWVPGPRQGEWTYDAYAARTDDGECYEIVQGVLVMSPAPRFKHQKCVIALSSYLYQIITERELGEVIAGPFDVILSEQDVFQPDLLVVLSEHLDRLHEEGVRGAPDLVIETISPSSKLYDRVIKHTVYEHAGIPEYWLMHPQEQTIELFVLENGKYRSLGVFSGEHILPSRIVPQMDRPVARFFRKRF